MKKSTFYLLAVFVGLSIALSLYLGGEMDFMFKETKVSALRTATSNQGDSIALRVRCRRPNLPSLPVDSSWQKFKAIEFDIKYNPATDDLAMLPKFTKKIKRLEGTTISLTGYLGNTHLFSAQRFQTSCLGPDFQEMVEIQPTLSKDYIGRRLTLQGTLALNDTEATCLALILNDVKILSVD